MKLQLQLFFGRARILVKEDAISKLVSLEKRSSSVKSGMLDQAYHDVYEYNTEEGSPSRAIAARAYKWMIGAKAPLLL